ncbi:MAG: AEC family transporter, partial [Solirubrobacteraceae bacterium]|nr:AEC family transporter [Solirubrobacteraceae bacterium]
APAPAGRPRLLGRPRRGRRIRGARVGDNPRMLALTLAIAASVAAGAWSQRRFGAGALALTRRLLDAMLYGALPLIVFFVLARTELTAGLGIGLLLAFAVHAVVGLVAWAIATRVLRLPPASAAMLVVAAVMANTGFFGAPVIATLLGHDELGAAITFDALVSGPMFFVVGFAIAAAFTTRGEPASARMRTYLLRNPPLLAVAAALVAPDALAPDVLVEIARGALIALAPVGFFVVGVQLAHERIGFPPPLGAPVAIVVGLRMVVAPLLLLGLVALTTDVPDAYLLQAAMPVGVNTLVVAHAYDLDRALAAAALAWSTALALAVALGAAAFA